MPPFRTLPPAKAIKTERTHEENQERAYIAASRRSDRSLEARIESARRASEIHKRRTGRSLRVTEQDVVNEEMYEEEDDDLPAQYRRLTAHLQTGSADFNRRLSAYLTNHVAMRSALEAAVQSSYAQQAQFSPVSGGGAGSGKPETQWPMQTSYQSPMMGSNPLWGQHTNNQQSSANANTTYQPTPYMQQQHGYRPSPATQGHRSPSTTTSDSNTSKGSAVGSSNASKDLTTSTISSPPTPSVKSDHSQSPPQFPAAYLPQWSSISAATNPSSSASYPPFFSSALPPESQLMLGSALDPADPLTSMFMAGSNSQPYNNYISGSQYQAASMAKSSGKSHMGPSFQGLHSTLAGGIDPSQLDVSFSGRAKDGSTRSTQDFAGSTGGGAIGVGGNSAPTTPGLGMEAWDHFLEEGVWDVSSSQG